MKKLFIKCEWCGAEKEATQENQTEFVTAMYLVQTLSKIFQSKLQRPEITQKQEDICIDCYRSAKNLRKDELKKNEEETKKDSI